MAARETRADAVMTVALEWIPEHCVIPDGFRAGEPFELYDWQFTYLAAFYKVKGSVVFDARNPILRPAFVYRQGLIVGPQKLGKDPLEAAHICLEAVGPVIFAGWAKKGDVYRCSDHGCRCGWTYDYVEGDPKGMPWPSPYIQITAFSEDQTGNTYGALRPMIDNGPLHDLIPKTGEEFIRLPGAGDCRITTVTSNAPTRLGQRTTFVIQGEVGIWTARTGMVKVYTTQNRNLAGFGGRSSLSTNAWDPAENSVGQQVWDNQEADVYKYFVRPPANLSYDNKVDRRKIHRIVYPHDVRRENGGHLDIDSIEAEAASLLLRNSAEAKRFFGNLLITGAGHAFDLDRWKSLAVKAPKVVPDGALIALGFDGSKTHDHTALVATELVTAYQWPLGIWRPEDYHGDIPADLVNLAVEIAFERWSVARLYADPPYWEETVAGWTGRWGKEIVHEWWTNRTRSMAYALRNWNEAQITGGVSHCAESDPLCALFTLHVGNAYKRETGFRDDGGTLWTIEKDRPGSVNKIDSDMAATLSMEARNDAIAAGALHLEPEGTSAYEDEEWLVDGKPRGITA